MPDREYEKAEHDAEAIFLPDAGGSGRLPARLLRARGVRPYTVRIAVLLASVAWMPLLALAAIDGVAWGKLVQVTFIRDFLPYGQLLIAVPVLILAELSVGRRLGLAVMQLQTFEVVDSKEAPRLQALVATTVARWRGRNVDLVLLLLTLAATVVSLWGARSWLTGSWQVLGEDVTLAGWWYLLISLPVMRFLALRWIWRLALWVWFLWEVSRLDMHPQSVHPDRAGGLAFLGGTQAAFGVLVFAFGVQLSCLIADAVYFRGADLKAFYGQMAAFVVIVVGVQFLPLLVFARELVWARERQLPLMSVSGHRGAGELSEKLRALHKGEFPTDTISGMTDFGALYENARLMRPVPIEVQHVLGLVAAAVVPFVPLVFLVMPAREVLQTLARLLM